MSDDVTSKKNDPMVAICEALKFLEKADRDSVQKNLDKGNIPAALEGLKSIKEVESLLYQAGCSGGERLPSGTSVPSGQGPSGSPRDTGKGGPG